MECSSLLLRKTERINSYKVILIVSNPGDDHATSVIKKLNEKGIPYYLFDTSNYPINAQLTFEYDCKMKEIFLWDISLNENVDLSKIKVGWWRRPLPIKIHEEIKDPNAIQFTYSECFAALSGLWESIDAFWINDPVLDDAASKKVFQLKVAGGIGFKTPKTCVTNNLITAQKFINSLPGKKIIYKSFLATPQAWRETRILKEDVMAYLDNVKYAPVIFQEFIPAVVDLRITVIGEQIFCIAVDTSKSDYEYDYRVTLQSAVIKSHKLPSNIKALLLKFMKRLGLVYGAIDMRLTPDGEYYFLEINTSGEWQFLEEQSNLKITDYFVDFIINKCK